MDRATYQKYLQSSAWRRTRDRKLIAADNRCQFRPCKGWYKTDYILGERCAATRNLQVHHLHYNTLGAERDSDLEVLCRFHHLVRHVASIECAYCGETIETDDDIAADMVSEAIAAVGGNIDNVNLDDLSWHNVCTSCDDAA
jgi:hypothetical protein